jgi:hypothetical protein
MRVVTHGKKDNIVRILKDRYYAGFNKPRNAVIYLTESTGREKAKVAPLPQPAFTSILPPFKFIHGLAKSQTNAQPAKMLTVMFFAVVRLEQPIHFIAFEARAGIMDRNNHLGVTCFCRERNGAGCRCEFKGIGQEVFNNLPDTPRICLDRQERSGI